MEFKFNSILKLFKFQSISDKSPTVCADKNETLVFVHFSAHGALISIISSSHQAEGALRFPKHPQLAKLF